MKKKDRRPVDVVVISDVHLGTYGSRAKELVVYMKSIQPKHVILNGDIIDIWQFNKRFFPKAHVKVIKQVLNWVMDGVKVTYITGNHDEMLRRFVGFKMGSFTIENKMLLELGKEQAWIFHGDVFDVTMQHSKWLAKMGAVGYDALILINNFCNWVSENIMKRGRISLSKKIKNSVKGALKFIDDFEQTAADIAIHNRYDYVVCGHIHHPQKRTVSNGNGEVMYLNSGDWIENLTALEFDKGEWTIFKYEEAFGKAKLQQDPEEDLELETEHLFKQMLEEFNMLKVSK